jgi:2-keto-3-deoxy-L-rhamnonate aldolase RhmA
MSEARAAQVVRRSIDALAALIVRVSDNSPSLIGRVLDAGADAVIVPMVSTPEEAEQAVRACRYPPEGIRSFGPNRSDLPHSPEELADRAQCFVMIETVEGVANADAIAAVPGLAGIVVGPGDLSISHGWPPMDGFVTDQILAPLAAIREACERHDVVLGIFAGSSASVARWSTNGVRLLITGSDLGLLALGAAGDLSASRAAVVD